MLVQTRRNKRAALKLMRKLLKKYGFVPDKLVTDDLISYRAAAGQLGSSTGGWREAWGRTQLTALKENLEGSREDSPPALQARLLGIVKLR